MINRTTLIKGPAYASYASGAYFSDGELSAVLVEKWSDIITSGFGRIGRTLMDRYVEVTFTPTMWLGLSTLFPYATYMPGDPIYGSTDAALVITPRNGRPLTVLNAQVTGLPGLLLAADRPTFKGPVKFTGLVANSSDPSLLASYFTQGTVGSNVALTGFVGADVLRSRYTGTWNSVTLRTAKGWEIDFNLQLEDDHPDGEVTVNKRMKQLEASASCDPTAIAESAYLALLNNAVDVGGVPTGYALAIAGVAASGAPAVTLNNAFIEDGGSYIFDPAKDRTGRLKFTTIRTISSGALASLWTIGTS